MAVQLRTRVEPSLLGYQAPDPGHQVGDFIV
jgi:hypothetical protein